MPRRNRGYQKLIRTIRDDHLSGASQLSREAANAVVAFSRETKAKSTERYYQSLLKAGKDLVCAQPDIIPIFNLINSILVAVGEHKNTLSLEELNQMVRKRAEEFQRSSLRSFPGLRTRRFSSATPGLKR